MSNNPFKGWGPGDPHPGPCHYNGPDIYNPGVPGPVPSPTFRPPHHHHIHPPRPPRPDNMKYVTKKEFNEVLDNIAAATLFEDNSESGTTAAFGNIPAGTKFSNKLSFTEFIKMALYGESTSTGGTTEGENETPITPPPSTDTGEGEDTNEYVTVDQFNSTITEITASIQNLSLKIDAIVEFINNNSFVTEQSMNTAIIEATRGLVNENTMATAISAATKDFVTSSTVDNAIDEATNGLATEKYVQDKIAHVATGGTIDLSDYPNNKQMNDAIAEATRNFVNEDAMNTAISDATRGLVSENAMTTAISNATKDFVTSSAVNTAITEATRSLVSENDMDTAISDATKDFVTSSNMSTAITEATSDLASKQYVDEKIEEIENSSISYSSLDQINRDSATLLVDAMCTD